MNPKPTLPLALLGVAAGCVLAGAPAAAAKKTPRGPVTAWILTRDGKSVEGVLHTDALHVTVDGKTRDVRLAEALSVNLAGPASATEAERITAGLAAVVGPDRKAREIAMTELSDIGLPALTPLLATYKDTDAHEPNPLYHLFARLVPGYADNADRGLDLIRLSDGEALRGQVAAGDLKLTTADGKDQTVSITTVRRLAIRQAEIERTFDIDSLRHCSQIEFLDSGVGVTPASKIEETSRGFVRLSFNIDGWSADPDGLKVPGPNYKTNLVDGFPFGALIARVGPTGDRWMAGKHVEKSAPAAGRLYFAVNDNGHWQNNIGSFRVKLHVKDAYDLGDPQ